MAKWEKKCNFALPLAINGVGNRDMEVVYDDNHIIIVNKSEGELVQGDRTGDPTLIDSVKAWIKKKYEKLLFFMLVRHNFHHKITIIFCF